MPATGRSPAHVRAPHTHTADRARPRHKVARIATATGAGRRCLSVTRCAGARGRGHRAGAAVTAPHIPISPRPHVFCALQPYGRRCAERVPALREYVQGLPCLERPRVIPVVVLPSGVRPYPRMRLTPHSSGDGARLRLSAGSTAHAVPRATVAFSTCAPAHLRPTRIDVENLQIVSRSPAVDARRSSQDKRNGELLHPNPET